MLGAYLLHTIRGQLTRPSEGLVSDYNLTIFLCAAEIRPVSHLIKMIHANKGGEFISHEFLNYCTKHKIQGELANTSLI